MQPAIDHDLHAAPSAWAPLGALLAVMLLSGATIAFDLALDRTRDRHAADLESSVQAVALVADLRTQLDHWSAADPVQRAAISRLIEADVRAFDPIATIIGAREEWSQLALVVHRLVAAERSTTPVVYAAAQSSLDRLAAGNQRGAAVRQAEMRGADRRRMLVRAFAGVATLLLCAAIALMVIRMVRRERALVRDHVARS